MLDIHERRKNPYFKGVDDRHRKRRGRNHETSNIDWSPKKAGVDLRRPELNELDDINEQFSLPSKEESPAVTERNIGRVVLSDKKRAALVTEGISIVLTR